MREDLLVDFSEQIQRTPFHNSLRSELCHL